MPEANVRSRYFPQFLFQEPHQLPLLALHAIRVIGIPGKQGHVEGRDRAGFAIAKLPGGRLEARLDHAVYDVKLIQQVEGRWVKGRPTQFFDRFLLGRQQRDRDIAPRQR